jgi:serine/threonine-protein kinase
MSPEQALGQPVDRRTDFYSLGIILFEMVAGVRPFRGGALSVLRDRVLAATPPALPDDVAARVDPSVQSIVRKLLMGNADARFQTATELATAIEAALGELAPAGRAVAAAEATRSSQAAPEPMAPRKLAAAMIDAASWELRRSLQRMDRRRRTIVAIGVAAGVLIILTVLMARVRSRPEALGPIDVAPTPASSRGVSTSSAPYDPAPPELPPPPSPAASDPVPSARPESSAGSQPPGGRRTGPGGIYIPPPRQWFR